MAMEDVSDSVARLVTLMHEQFRASEVDIAVAVAAADGPLSIDDLVEETGYTERTVKKRAGTLEEQLHGEPFLTRSDDGAISLHPEFAAAIRQYEESSE